MEYRRIMPYDIWRCGGILFFVVLFLVSCTKSEPEYVAPKIKTAFMGNVVVGGDGERMTVQENHTLVLDNEARGDYRLSDEELAGNVLSFVSGGVGRSSDVRMTRSVADIDIKNVRPLRGNAVMSVASNNRAPVSPVVVEFNSQDGGGYAVCSADKRFEKVFSYVPYGSMDDTSKIEVLRHFYRNVEACIADSVAVFNATVDSLRALGRRPDCSGMSSTVSLSGNQNDIIYLGEEYVPGLIKEASIGMKTKWDQGAPYNNRMPEKNDNIFVVDSKNNRAVAGCATIALAQAIAYKKHDVLPDLITSSMWNDISSRADITGSKHEDIVAQFIWHVADSIKVSYSPDGTAARIGSVFAYLYYLNNDRHIGNYEERYALADNSYDKRHAFIFDFLYASAASKDPIIVNADLFDGTKSVGHAFLITGTKCSDGGRYEVVGTEYNGGINKMYRLLDFECHASVECNWGWGGSSDGFYDYDNMVVGRSKVSPSYFIRVK